MDFTAVCRKHQKIRQKGVMKKKTRILIEIERVRVSYQINKRLEKFCQKCGIHTDFLPETEAVELIGNLPVTDFHTEELPAPNRQLIFCLKSILEKIPI